MTKIASEKQKLRKIYQQKRLALKPQDVSHKSQKICNNFIKYLLPDILKKNPKAKFAIYFPSRNEVDTQTLAQHFLNNKNAFSYPKIKAKHRPLRFVKYEQQSFTTSKNYKNILELKTGEEIIPDIILIPLVAFDENRNRLGMGGGFFDRTLSHFATKKHKITTIGLAYDLQKHDSELPKEKTDQTLDFIACESGIIS